MGANKPPVVIIGAGIGGLSAAVRLASAGERVLVLEQNQSPGGKMNELRLSGFRWDTGPSVITMRGVLEDLFAAAGSRLDEHIHLTPIEPLTRYFYTDGTRIDATRDLEHMQEQIRQLEPADVGGYENFLAYAARLHRIVGPVFIYDHPPSLKSFMRVSPLDALQVDGLRTMHQAQRGFVRSPHLLQLLGRFASYVGASPYQAPATLNVIAHVELNEGVWYPSAGVYSLAEALLSLAGRLGVEIKTGLRVSQIEVRDNQITGVRLQDGGWQGARAVLANVDITTVHQDLLPSRPAHLARLNRLLRREPSCSGFILLLGVRGSNPQLAHHNIFFSRDYRREFGQIFQSGVMPDDPTIYVAITARTTPSDAPPGYENWFVLVNAPALGPAWFWPAQAKPYRDLVLDRLAAFGFDIRDKIVVESAYTPEDLQKLTGSWRGALYGASSNSRWAAFQRPHNRDPHIRGLYYAGGSTHPGGGVPMVMLSGKVASGMLLSDLSANRT